MFGLDKLMAMKKQAEEIKERLNSITVEGLAEGGKVKIVANGNKKITAVHIDSEWLKQAESEEVEDLIAIACNRAIENAEKLSESEMRGMLPGLGF
jgi:DNA-binding YbaB/EbfC family protein